MRTKNRPIEVLAPAGSMECLKAAILNGADAVYLGGEMFGARAYAGNFNKEELLEAIDYVHLYGKKLFLTVNTLMKEEELPLLPGFLSTSFSELICILLILYYFDFNQLSLIPLLITSIHWYIIASNHIYFMFPLATPCSINF